MNTNKPAQALELYFESTPNPASYKLFVNQQLVPSDEPFDFTPPVNAQEAPLPAALFKHFPIQRVFIMHNFITITCASAEAFGELSPQLIDFVKHYLTARGTVLAPSLLAPTKPIAKESPLATNDPKNPNDPAERIKQVLDEYVKPAIARDGGAITFHSFDQGVVKLNLQGACSGCPSATITLQAGIEQLLKSMIPEVKQVEAVQEK